VIAEAEAGVPPTPTAVKLYNASNFFDPRAVPPSDDGLIAERVRSFSRVIVESHPRFIQSRCFEFSDRLSGTLEVAIGLETSDASVLSRLNKEMTRDDFAAAATKLRAADIALRVFLLLPPPFVPESQVVDSVTRSVIFAAEKGARFISLIPTRVEHARDGDLKRPAAVVAPRLDLVEDVVDRCREVTDAVVAVDLWDIDRLASCDRCGPARIDRLRTLNLSGQPAARAECPSCISSIVGSGFGGTILGRVARSQGHDVTLIDQGTHPRFALGESSTPLAAISLERLAARYGLVDLHHLPTYGRWRDHLPSLRCGLKRGFTFYRHHGGKAFQNDVDNSHRLLVAASPDDAVSDTHWFREDVDHFLVRRAESEGVRYLDRTEVTERRRCGRYRAPHRAPGWSTGTSRAFGRYGRWRLLTLALWTAPSPMSARRYTTSQTKDGCTNSGSTTTW